MRSPQTISHHFLQQVRKYGAGKVALRQKEFGIWREFTWQESYEQVRAFALGMMVLGLQRGDHVCAIGDNDRQYLWGFLGLLAAGAAGVGLYTDAIPSEMAYIINHCEATFALAKDQEQCDKLLSLKEDLPGVRRVIYWEERGLWSYDDAWLISFQEVQMLGQALLETEPERFETEVALGTAADIALLCYTSGTTGLPKGVMLTHANLLAAATAFFEVDPRYDSDNHVSFMPMGWIAEPVFGIVPHCITGMIMNFPEEPETVQENIREIAPENLFYSARLWDGLVGSIAVQVAESTWLNRKLYHVFLPVGYRMADRRLVNRPAGFWLRLGYWLGELLVFGPLRNQLGLSRVRSAYTAGAVLSPDHIRFYHAVGINLKQIYGSTEVSGGATVHRDGDIKFASVGVANPGFDVHTADNGELMIAGPGVMAGYYRDPEATARDLWVDEDGRRWFLTGDAGYIDEDGHIIYLDRIKEMITLANGERFSPQFIEGRLKFSPYIRDVMAVGDPTREFVTALIVIDYGHVSNWAERRGLGFTTFLDLSQKPAVTDLVQAAVADVNENLPPNGRVGRFVLMHKEFDADEAEMTRSRKLRRSVLYDKYGEIIEAMYAEKEQVDVRATVTYQDGSEAVVESSLRIVSLGAAAANGRGPAVPAGGESPESAR